MNHESCILLLWLWLTRRNKTVKPEIAVVKLKVMHLSKGLHFRFQKVDVLRNRLR
jgi:hypothetical protein